MQDIAEDAGHKRSRTGQEGYVGEKCGGWFWGHRTCDSRTMLEASGERSQLLLQTLKRDGLDCQGTRVDLHVTYERARHDSEWAIEMRKLLRDSETAREIRRHVKARIWDDPDRGNTLETYSRKSRRYLRDYHKAAEQRHTLPESTFRAEGEWKRELAKLMYRRVRDCIDPRMLALDVLTTEWRRLGIDRNWDWQGQPVDLAIEHRPADQVRTAQWLVNTAAVAFKKVTIPQLRAEVMGAFFSDPAATDEIAVPVPEVRVVSPPDPVPPKDAVQLAAWHAEKAWIDVAHAAQDLGRLEEVAAAASADFERLLGM